MRRFGHLYEQKYGKGSAYKEAGMEMITFKLKAIGRLARYKLRTHRTEGANPRRALIDKRRVYFEAGGFIPANFYDYKRLTTGNLVRGPSVILAPTTTIVVNPSWTAEIDRYLNVILTRRG